MKRYITMNALTPSQPYNLVHNDLGSLCNFGWVLCRIMQLQFWYFRTCWPSCCNWIHPYIYNIWMSIFFRSLHNKIHSCWFLGTDFSGPPEYTVTSPRPSVVAGNVAGEMKHRVQAAADYKAAESQDADHTVLLKLKEGDEYKLVLNMQVCNLILRKHILVKDCYLVIQRPCIVHYQWISELLSRKYHSQTKRRRKCINGICHCWSWVNRRL